MVIRYLEENPPFAKGIPVGEGGGFLILCCFKIKKTEGVLKVW